MRDMIGQIDCLGTRPAEYLFSPCLVFPNSLFRPGGGSFDLILAADVVWLDDLVVPLVRTLERLTARWPHRRTENTRKRPGLHPQPILPKGAQGECMSAEELVVETPSEIDVDEGSHGGAAAILRSQPRVGRRVLIAYQWRSERTGRKLLEELDAAFNVREIPPEVR